MPPRNPSATTLRFRPAGTNPDGPPRRARPIVRAMTYVAADSAFAEALREKISPKAFREIEPKYYEEVRTRFTSKPGLVFAPETVEEVRTILMAANAARIRVIPFGGGTGLVGGHIASDDGPPALVLSVERLNRIRAMLPEENVVIAEAGVILQDLHDAARAVDRLYPLSLAAKGTARIGGNLATNAGGVNVLRYGNTRDLCLGVEAVLPDGRVLNGLSRLRKDNTGYDIKDLFIGSEGTLGIITAASLKLAPIPPEEGTACMVVPDPEAALKLLAMAKNRLGEGVSAFELIRGLALEFTKEHLPQVKRPFDPSPDWFVLIDIGLARGTNPQEQLEQLFEEAAEAGVVTDGVVAQSEGQRQEMWDLRENLPASSRAVGAVASHDVSLPLGAIPEFIRRGDQIISRFGLRVNCFGHLGDGNLHYNVFPPPGGRREDHWDRYKEISGEIHDLLAELAGSFSAEHGVGRLKTGDLVKYGDPVKLELMRGIKRLFDPNGIMNPGAVLAEI